MQNILLLGSCEGAGAEDIEQMIRIENVSKWYGDIPAYALMAMNFYVFFTFLTDNTSFYFPNNVLYRMAVMVWCFEVAEKRARTLEINELIKGGIHENNCNSRNI